MASAYRILGRVSGPWLGNMHFLMLSLPSGDAFAIPVHTDLSNGHRYTSNIPACLDWDRANHEPYHTLQEQIFRFTNRGPHVSLILRQLYYAFQC